MPSKPAGAAAIIQRLHTQPSWSGQTKNVGKSSMEMLGERIQLDWKVVI
jgi:hypothetical protein